MSAPLDSDDDAASADGGSAPLAVRAQARFPGGGSRTTLFVPGEPHYAARARGWCLTDVDGHELIDLHGNFTALIHGHAFAPVLRAASQALGEGASFGLPTRAEIELAEHLAQRIEWAERWRFTPSGTEAVMAAVRAARAYTGRDLVLRFEGCYHGAWDALTSVAGRGVPASSRAAVLELPREDPGALLATLDEHEGSVACVLVDLMPNRAGLRPMDVGFAELLREQTHARGIVLILDEVITFRLSRGGMQERYGIQGDIVTLGKSIGGGLPVGALGGRSGPMDVFDPRRADAVPIAGTFSANPVTMRAGLAALRAFEDERIERLSTLGERLRGGLRSLGYEVSGAGSLCKLHAVDMAGLWRAAYREGALIGADGLLATCTPMDEGTIDRALEAFERVRGANGRSG